jgi:hypothetical protein
MTGICVFLELGRKKRPAGKGGPSRAGPVSRQSAGIGMIAASLRFNFGDVDDGQKTD